MIRLDDAFLVEVGLERLPDKLRELMLQHVYDTLEIRVGTALADQMSEAQLDEFENIIDADDEGAALTWLEANLPDYKAVVNQKLEELKAEIRGTAADILKNEGIESGPPALAAAGGARPGRPPRFRPPAAAPGMPRAARQAAWSGLPQSRNHAATSLAAYQGAPCLGCEPYPN